MKYHLLFCLSTIAYVNANSFFQDYQINDEFDEILTPKRKPLDPELADLVIKTTAQSTQALAQIIQKCAKDPNIKCPFRILFTGGNDITNKKLAQAIAENADVPHIQINVPFLLNANRTLTPAAIDFLNNIIKTTQKVIITFAGFDCVSDWDYAAAISLLLNRFEDNDNITVIGIVNNPQKMPQFLKEIFFDHIYFIKDTATVEQKKALLHYQLKKYNNECDDKCENYISKLLKIANSEDIADIVEYANSFGSLGQEKRTVTQKKLEDAIKRYKANRDFFEKRK